MPASRVHDDPFTILTRNVRPSDENLRADALAYCRSPLRDSTSATSPLEQRTAATPVLSHRSKNGGRLTRPHPAPGHVTLRAERGKALRVPCATYERVVHRGGSPHALGYALAGPAYAWNARLVRDQRLSDGDIARIMRSTAQIHALYVLPEHRESGLGRLLLASMLDALVQQDIHLILCDLVLNPAAEEDPSHHLFARQRFQPLNQSATLHLNSRRSTWISPVTSNTEIRTHVRAQGPWRAFPDSEPVTAVQVARGAAWRPS